MDALRPNSPYPRAPVYGGRTPGTQMVAAGADSLLRGAGSLSLPLSSISGAGASTGLSCAWVVQYTPYSVICRGRCLTGPDGAPGRRALHKKEPPLKRADSPFQGGLDRAARVCHPYGDIFPWGATTRRALLNACRGRQAPRKNLPFQRGLGGLHPTKRVYIAPPRRAVNR